MSVSSMSFGNHTFSAIISAESHVRPKIVYFISDFGCLVTQVKDGLNPSKRTPEKIPYTDSSIVILRVPSGRTLRPMTGTRREQDSCAKNRPGSEITFLNGNNSTSRRMSGASSFRKNVSFSDFPENPPPMSRTSGLNAFGYRANR